MSKKQQHRRLEEVLKTYGANPARWPSEERAGLLVVAGDADVERLVREAREIDLVLDNSAKLTAPQGALERMKSAAGMSRDELSQVNNGKGANAEIIDLPTWRTRAQKDTSQKAEVAQHASNTPNGRSAREFFVSVVAIAACLLLGVLVGTSQLAEQYLAVETIVAGNASDEQDDGLLGLVDGSFEDGDML